MPTMYETIQGLPLFKGTTTDQISAFLEKTHVEFVNFSPGCTLVEVGEPCTELKFLISGAVRTRVSLAGGRASLSYVSGYGTVLSPCHLFGFHTDCPVSVESLDEGSYMRIRKDQYLELLQTDTIYLLNYLNYLSFHAQRSRLALCGLGGGSLGSWINAVRSGLQERRTSDARICTTRSDLVGILDIPADALDCELEDMMRRGEIGVYGDLAIALN